MAYDLVKGCKVVSTVRNAKVAYKWYCRTYGSAVYRVYPDGSRVLWLARQMMGYHLKTCPMCDSVANQPRAFRDGFGIECSNKDCSVAVYNCITITEAIKTWNTRKREDRLLKRGKK